MKFFDFHCDTPYEMYKKKQPLDSGERLYVNLDRARAAFADYGQVFAVCAPRKMSDEDSWLQYLAIAEDFKRELSRLSERVIPCTSGDDLDRAWSTHKTAAFFAVEDARILAGDLSRLDTLYKNNCRFLTLVWGGDSCVGGAHNTENGLTEFGKAVSRRCFETGIIPDISHSSERVVDELLDIAEEYGKPVIATHSNSYGVYGHTRNLRDRHFIKLAAAGGVVGISLCDIHLQPAEKGHPGIDSVIAHIEHYLELGGENSIAFGCDLDGCDLPDGLNSLADIPKLFDRMAQLNYPETLIEKISFSNAKSFICKNLH